MTTDLYQTPLRYGKAYDELSADGVNPRAHWAHLIFHRMKHEDAETAQAETTPTS